MLFSAGCVAVIRIGQLVTRHILRDSDDDNDDDDDDGDDDGDEDEGDEVRRASSVPARARDAS